MSRLAVGSCTALLLAGLGWQTVLPPPRDSGVAPRPVHLAFSAPSTPTDSIRFNAERVAVGAHRYDLVISLRGEEKIVGSSDVVLTRVGDNMRFTAVTFAPQLAYNDRVEVLFNATSLAPLSHVADAMGGMSQGHTSIAFADGRAKGRVQVPTAQGVRTSDVDVAMDADVTDEAIADVLLATADLEKGMSGSYRAFRASTGKIESTRVRVADRETISVPAGKFEVFRIEVRDGRETLFVTTAEPRIVVASRTRQAGTAASVEMRLVR